jgi:hypothetical protein
MTRGFFIHKNDSVVTLLDSGKAGDEITLIGEKTFLQLDLQEKIKEGHKAACKNIKQGEQVIKYGFPIGVATRDIRVGEWVHTHNIASNYDQQDSSPDLATGAFLDRRYE